MRKWGGLGMGNGERWCAWERGEGGLDVKDGERWSAWERGGEAKGRGCGMHETGVCVCAISALTIVAKG